MKILGRKFQGFLLHYCYLNKIINQCKRPRLYGNKKKNLLRKSVWYWITLVRLILNNNQHVLLVWGNLIKKEHHIKKYQHKYRNPAYHDFMFLGTNTEESQIICWVQLTHHTTGFICKLTDQTSILNGGGVVQS